MQSSDAKKLATIHAAFANSKEFLTVVHWLACEVNDAAHMLKTGETFAPAPGRFSEIQTRLMKVARVGLPGFSLGNIAAIFGCTGPAVQHHVKSIANYKNWSYYSKQDRQNGRVPVLQYRSKRTKDKGIHEFIQVKFKGNRLVQVAA
jgi:hypothetical protein